MKLNRSYERASELPAIIPVFPLAGALLLPRRPLPLSIFEPRFLAMLDDALSGERVIGMIQPSGGEEATDASPELCAIGCAGRITQFANRRRALFHSLTGGRAFASSARAPAATPYRQARVDFAEFSADFHEGDGESAVDRAGLLTALRKFAEANKFKVDWDDIQKASNEALVNGLSMLSPYGAREKQALLEAADLRARAEMLVAITQMDSRAVKAPRRRSIRRPVHVARAGRDGKRFDNSGPAAIMKA